MSKEIDPKRADRQTNVDKVAPGRSTPTKRKGLYSSAAEAKVYVVIYVLYVIT